MASLRSPYVLPLGFAAGDPNLSRYVGNSPTNWVDPSGLRGTEGFLAPYSENQYVPPVDDVLAHEAYVEQLESEYYGQLLPDLNCDSICSLPPLSPEEQASQRQAHETRRRRDLEDPQRRYEFHQDLIRRVARIEEHKRQKERLREVLAGYRWDGHKSEALAFIRGLTSVVPESIDAITAFLQDPEGATRAIVEHIGQLESLFKSGEVVQLLKELFPDEAKLLNGWKELSAEDRSFLLGKLTGKLLALAVGCGPAKELLGKLGLAVSRSKGIARKPAVLLLSGGKKLTKEELADVLKALGKAKVAPTARPTINTRLPSRVTGELPAGQARTPAEVAQARNFFERNRQAARDWWSERNGGRPWPAESTHDSHPRPIKDGGDPLFIEPGYGRSGDVHRIPRSEYGGLSDFQRWGQMGGRPKKNP